MATEGLFDFFLNSLDNFTVENTQQAQNIFARKDGAKMNFKKNQWQMFKYT